MNNVRKTSIATYIDIERSGLLSKKRLEVFRILHDEGPLTGAQVSKIHGETYGANTVSETVRNRITELYEYGVVEEAGKGPCPITGREVIIWQVSGRMPVKPPKKQTFRQKKDELLEDIVEVGKLLEFYPVPREKLLEVYYKLKKL